MNAQNNILKQHSTSKNIQLVINWHINEKCNFRCKYCYASWDRGSSEIFKNSEESEKLILQISKLRSKGFQFDNIRLSFAGGEPTLDKNLPNKIKIAAEAGLSPSLITNGSKLNYSYLQQIAPYLSIIGISIDSISSETNSKIGRMSGSKLINYKELSEDLNRIRSDFPHLKVKINTVVNKYNYKEDLCEFIHFIHPDKWKILRVLPADRKSAGEVITDEMYEQFKIRHSKVPYSFFENNNDMFNSYLMIDPYGRFFWNIPDFNRPANSTYGYSKPINEVGIQKALSEADFNFNKFSNRY